MALVDSPLQQAMAENGTEAGPEPLSLGAEEWLTRLAELPLAFQPGEGWRYHHSFSVLGILLARLTGRPLGEHLAEDLFGPLGMTDTALWVPEEKLDRLPAAYRHGEDGLVETEPAGGGFYAGPPPFDVSHGELVSTAARLPPLRTDARRRRSGRRGAGDLGRPPAADDQRPGARRVARRRKASSPASGTRRAGDSAWACRRRDRGAAATAGPAVRAPTSSSIATGPSASSSPRSSWASTCGHARGVPGAAHAVLVNRFVTPGMLPVMNPWLWPRCLKGAVSGRDLDTPCRACKCGRRNDGGPGALERRRPFGHQGQPSGPRAPLRYLVGRRGRTLLGGACSDGVHEFGERCGDLVPGGCRLQLRSGRGAGSGRRRARRSPPGRSDRFGVRASVAAGA